MPHSRLLVVTSNFPLIKENASVTEATTSKKFRSQQRVNVLFLDATLSPQNSPFSRSISPQAIFSGYSLPLPRRRSCSTMDDWEFELPTFMEEEPQVRGTKRAAVGEGKVPRPSDSKGTSSGSSAGKVPQQLEEIIIAAAELSLETKADTRETKGYSQWTALIPSQCHWAKESLQEAGVYNELLKKKRGEDIGAAHIRIALKGIQGMKKMEEFSKNQEFLSALRAFYEGKVKTMSSEELKEEIHVFRMFKPKISVARRNKDDKEIDYGEGGYCRAVFRFKPAVLEDNLAETLQVRIIQVCKENGWEVLFGTAPKSQKERKLIDALKNRKK